jgi:predicted flavoprotein YhiN
MDAVDLVVLGAGAVEMASAETPAGRGDSVRVAGPRRPT